MPHWHYSVSGYTVCPAMCFKQMIELSVAMLLHKSEKVEKEMWSTGKLQEPVDIGCLAKVHSIRLPLKSQCGTDHSCFWFIYEHSHMLQIAISTLENFLPFLEDCSIQNSSAFAKHNKESCKIFIRICILHHYRLFNTNNK